MSDPRRAEPPAATWRDRALAAIAVAAVAVVVGAALLVGPGREPSGDDVAALVRDAESYVGRRVTVSGRVGQIVSAQSFTVTDGTGRILVLDVSVVPAVDNDLDGVLTDERVRVTGVVRVFALDEIESEVGELMDERYERFVGEPVLLADAITPR